MPEGRSGRGAYEVSVLAANENADMDRGVTLEGRGFLTWVKVTYSETTADPWLSQLPPEQRGCLFEDERPGNLFDHIATTWYTQETCLFACRLAFLVDRCGCYPYLIAKQGKLVFAHRRKQKTKTLSSLSYRLYFLVSPWVSRTFCRESVHPRTVQVPHRLER